MTISDAQREQLSYYVCGKISEKNLDEYVRKNFLQIQEIKEIRRDVVENLQYAEYYAGKGLVNLLIKPIEDIEKLLKRINLFIPPTLKNNIIKIGLINGIPMEYKYLSMALNANDNIGIQQHWKFFSNYILMLDSYFGNNALSKGEMMVLERWKGEYFKLKNFFENRK